MVTAPEVGGTGKSIILDASLKTATRIFTLLLLALLNPFEIVSWSDQRSNELWQRLHAEEYGSEAQARHIGPRAGVPGGRDSITIVYFDDASLKAMNDTRPLSAFLLGDLIDDVRLIGGAAGAPTAIFIDMLLTDAAPKDASRASLIATVDGEADQQPCASRKPVDGRDVSPFRCLLRQVAEITQFKKWQTNPRCQISTLNKLDCIRAAKGLPLLFADPRTLTRAGQIAAAENETSPALDALGFVAAAVPVGVEERAYPLAAPADAVDREGAPFRLYPATALYVLWCRSHPGTCSAIDPRDYPVFKDDLRRPNLAPAYDRKLAVTWGIGGPQKHDGKRYWFAQMMLRQRGGSQEAWCRPARPGLSATSGRLIALATSGVNFVERDPCLYTQAVPYSLLQSAVTQGELAKLFGGRLVMIGGQFADSNDRIAAAPFGSVPGVYYHAMALDNLIEQKSAYAKIHPPITPRLDVSWADLAELIPMAIVTFLLAVTAGALDRLPSTAKSSPVVQRRVRRARARILCWFAVALALVFFVFADGLTLVPHSFNLVAVTLLCLLSARDIIWAAIRPLRERVARRLDWHALVQALIGRTASRYKPGRGDV